MKVLTLHQTHSLMECWKFQLFTTNYGQMGDQNVGASGRAFSRRFNYEKNSLKINRLPKSYQIWGGESQMGGLQESSVKFEPPTPKKFHAPFQTGHSGGSWDLCAVDLNSKVRPRTETPFWNGFPTRSSTMFWRFGRRVRPKNFSSVSHFVFDRGFFEVSAISNFQTLF